MALLKPIDNGRMYPGWWRWNPIGGCEHDCSYCYMKVMSNRTGLSMMTPVVRDGHFPTQNYMSDNLGSGRKIFCCSSGDAWGYWVPSDWIYRMLDHCLDYSGNEYMMLTKNPLRYAQWYQFHEDCKFILGATVETDLTKVARSVSDAPDPLYRMAHMKEIKEEYPNVQTMLSIEPVMRFTPVFAERIEAVLPDIVYIGVDSGKNGLLEPTRDELIRLIIYVSEVAELHLKKGIERIVGADWLASWRGEKPEIQIIQEPQLSGEIETCSRWSIYERGSSR